MPFSALRLTCLFFTRAAAPEPDRATWQKAFKLYVEAFKEPKSPQAKKKLDQILKNPLPAHIDAELFSYEGFLRGLGRMSLSKSMILPHKL